MWFARNRCWSAVNYLKRDKIRVNEMRLGRSAIRAEVSGWRHGGDTGAWNAHASKKRRTRRVHFPYSCRDSLSQCPFMSDTKGHKKDRTWLTQTNLLPPDMKAKFSLFNIASVTKWKYPFCTQTNAKRQRAIGIICGRLNWNFVSLFLGFEVSHRF